VCASAGSEVITVACERTSVATVRRQSSHSSRCVSIIRRVSATAVPATKSDRSLASGQAIRRARGVWLNHEVPASSLDEAYDEGRAAWPDVPLDRARFDAYLTERQPESGELARLAVADLYRAAAAATGEARALAAFDRVLAAEVAAAADAAKADASTRD